MKNFKIFLTILLIFNSSYVTAQNVLPDDFDSFVNKIMKENNLPGLAIAIIENDSLVFIKGYGVRKISESDPIDEHTLFQAASLTKTFTATLMGILVDQGKIAWDDPVKKYIKNFELKENYVTERLTIRDVLSARAGIIGGDTIQANDRRELIGLLKKQPLSDSFRIAQTSFNLMYAIAGYIEEIIYEKPWEEIVKNTILDPLGMEETYTDNASAINSTNNVAIPHLIEDGKVVPTAWGDYELYAPAASIVTNVLDLSKWMKLLLNNGSLENKTIIRDKTLNQIQSPQILVSDFFKNICNPFTNFITFGFGWFISDYKGNKVIEMEGAVPGTSNLLVLVPSARMGLAIQTNCDFAFKSLLPIKFYLFDYFLSKKSKQGFLKKSESASKGEFRSR